LHLVDGGHVIELYEPRSQVMTSPPSGEQRGWHVGYTSEPLEPPLAEPQSSMQPDSHPVNANTATMDTFKSASNQSRPMEAAVALPFANVNDQRYALPSWVPVAAG
jgi:hypothetical protein